VTASVMSSLRTMWHDSILKLRTRIRVGGTVSAEEAEVKDERIRYYGFEQQAVECPPQKNQ